MKLLLNFVTVDTYIKTASWKLNISVTVFLRKPRNCTYYKWFSPYAVINSITSNVILLVIAQENKSFYECVKG